MKDVKEGVVATGQQDQENSLTQLSYLKGLIADHLMNVYVTDCYLHRIMR